MEPISWQAPSFHYVEKSSTWYMWSIIISVVAVGLALLQGNLLFVFFVIIGEAVILMLGKQKPRLVTYEATGSSLIASGHREYLYKELNGFSLVEDHFNERYKELVLTPSSKIGAHIKILVPAERAEDVKVWLLRYLAELPYEETMSENILKRIGL